MDSNSDYNKREEDDDDDDEEDDEIDDAGYKTVKDAVLFAIDISPSMLEKPPPSDDKKAERDSPASAALKCAHQLMQQRIISHPNDMMGILLFGTEQTKLFGEEDEHSRGNLAYPHCYLLTDLDVPSAQDVKKLRNLVDDEEEAQKLLIAAREKATMANVLFGANTIFTTKAPNFSSRRLFLVTDDDDPHGKDKDLRRSATQRAKDLYDLGVIFELFPISKPGRTFDRGKFYDDIVYRVGPSADNDAPAPLTSAAKTSKSGDGISLLQSLLSAINSKAAPRRALFSLPFEIAPDLRISVKGYIIIKRQEPIRSCYVWVAGEKPQIAMGTSTQVSEDTSRTVEKSEVKKAYKFGGETVVFTPDELKTIRHFGDPVIRIIGFKPLSMLPIWANTRAPMFMYPTEDDYIGSSRVFSALWQKLLKDTKFALAWCIVRKNAAPVLSALIPGAEKYDDGDEQLIPPGLWIVPLPFADDIRQNPETPHVQAPDSLIDMMRTVIQQLQLPKAVYDPHKYPNPSLQWFYKVLQALALDDDIPEKADDKTVPRHRQIDKRAGNYVIEWGEELEEQYQLWQKEHSRSGMALKSIASKRTADSMSGPPTKKSKTASAVVKDEGGISDEQMKSNFERGIINKLTVPILKDWAHAKHISTSGKKAELVERIEEYFEKK
ncbi:protein Ku70 [Patellaria atrata CBS 101060]|uniref:ATP-dependent DNA helicase II subunit 1 n=1 Tax=Patellaria atrata CBS 101060 TaxID=1346257 RepID=A0A9P4S5X8_9PEZI|nr:protein Ku70 [Patellaria atrata CBS 101060]